MQSAIRDQVIESCVRVSRMNIGRRLYELRESKKFSQGDIEKRTGRLRCDVDGFRFPTSIDDQRPS